MEINLKKYREMLEQPWGKIQYNIIFEQLKDLKNLRILDFGSGFGMVSHFLAQRNQVIAVEPNEKMLYADEMHHYQKILGSIEQLVNFKDETFDVIICHNVLEYIDPQQRGRYLHEFKRVLKKQGKLSIVKHNPVGKVLQSVIFSNDTTTALSLLDGENFKTESFGQASSYSIEELVKSSQLKLINYLGVRTFYGL